MPSVRERKNRKKPDFPRLLGFFENNIEVSLKQDGFPRWYRAASTPCSFCSTSSRKKVDLGTRMEITIPSLESIQNGEKIP